MFYPSHESLIQKQCRTFEILVALCIDFTSYAKAGTFGRIVGERLNPMLKQRFSRLKKKKPSMSSKMFGRYISQLFSKTRNPCQKHQLRVGRKVVARCRRNTTIECKHVFIKKLIIADSSDNK